LENRRYRLMEDEEIVDTMELAEEDAKGGDGNE
jgi:hypothetical protein